MATLSYELKGCMPMLCKDARWNVLTVLILHANIRNRCYVSMETLAEMAASTNLTKATRAKKWLEQHGAFELVPYNKRVDEEKDLPKRQHVYQLTGQLKCCEDIACECQKVLKQAQPYLHYAKQEPVKSEIPTIENFRRAEIPTIQILNGRKGSITNESIKDHTAKSGSKSYDDIPHKDRTLVIEAWAKNLLAAPTNAYKTDANHEAAADIARAGYQPEQVGRYVKAMMAEPYWRGKTLSLRKVSELMPNWLATHPTGSSNKPTVLDGLKIITADDTERAS